jgi:hypothetical protein
MCVIARLSLCRPASFVPSHPQAVWKAAQPRVQKFWEAGKLAASSAHKFHFSKHMYFQYLDHNSLTAGPLAFSSRLLD